LHFSSVLPQQGSVAELPSGSLMGFFRRHPLADIALGQQVQMVHDFGLKIRILVSIAEWATGLCQQSVKRCHRHHLCPSKRKTRPMTPEICSQSPVSLASCFNTLMVME